MKRVLTIVAMTALTVGMFAGSAVAKKDSTPKANKLAAKQCQAEKQALGNKAFKETYGGKRAMQQCKRSERGEEREQIRNAAQECKAEREADTGPEEGTTFSDYGTNKNGKNAFGKCVSSKVKAEDEAEVEATENAAKQCKAERRTDGDEAFTEKYGTNKNGKNAFGKCVSQHSEEELEEEETEGTTEA